MYRSLGGPHISLPNSSIEHLPSLRYHISGWKAAGTFTLLLFFPPSNQGTHEEGGRTKKERQKNKKQCPAQGKTPRDRAYTYIYKKKASKKTESEGWWLRLYFTFQFYLGTWNSWTLGTWNTCSMYHMYARIYIFLVSVWKVKRQTPTWNKNQPKSHHLADKCLVRNWHIFLRQRLASRLHFCLRKVCVPLLFFRWKGDTTLCSYKYTTSIFC